MEQQSRHPVVVRADEGNLLVTQVERLAKVDSGVTEGRLSISLVTLPLGFAGPPAHRHLKNDEVFFVLEGAFTFRIEDERLDVGSGALVYVPAGTVHTFMGRGGSSGRMLEMFTPADFEGYFTELAELRLTDRLDRVAIGALQAKYGMEVVGPPLGDRGA